jgi:UDP-N-acetylglucosamine--N-acetylmuramyl-(pentapeptide) pyrophosphoryl-undecaprenol N-acetylglucosamine transferase
MNIVLTGGGSGGHITPILAVAHELKQKAPDCRITYVGQRGDALLDIVHSNPAIDAVETIWAGKLRRYNGEGWRQLLNIRTQLLNIRDVFRTMRGIVQSYVLLRRLRPDVLFTRGGFVSVPVALAAKLLAISYITHDSDSTPSLANRLIARWAVVHAVALPPELYPYPLDKTVMVGVPVSRHYHKVSATQQQQFRHELGLDDFSQTILITGGGNGARKLNIAVVHNARYLLAAFPDLAILHVAGRALEDETNSYYDELRLGKARSRVQVHGFVTDMYRYSGAADIIVARGGATNLAEFALQAKPVVIVPSAQLVWNVKNSQALQQRGAVVELNEDQAEQPERLGRLLGGLLADEAQRLNLSVHLSEIARPDAAAGLADIIIRIGTGE